MKTWDSIASLADKVSAGKLSAESLVRESLSLIEQHKEYNAIIHVNEYAIAQAKAIDEKIKNKQPAGKLAGVPYIAKDNFLTKGVETTAASAILRGFMPPYSATSIERLEAQGAIMVAKANLDAFAHGGSTEHSAFGPSLNPHDKTRVPGGSSGGSGVAVALGLAPFALGTDTGGSIRLPASFCGVVGYKPTYGIVSRYGVVAMASSTDVIGPLTRSVEDAALVLDVLAGADPLDSTMIPRDVESYTVLNSDLRGKKIGKIKEYFTEGLEPSVQKNILRALDLAAAAGAEIVDVSLPMLRYALGCYYVIVPAEVSSNLSRYDGIRYGFSSPGAASLDDVYELTRVEGFEDENQRRIMIGNYVLSSGYYDAYYKKAQSVRTLLIDDFTKTFSSVDYIVGPTSPSVAFPLGSNVEDPLKMYLVDIMTVAANLAGLPAISIPCGSDEQGLPIGLQLMAPQKEDRKLLGIADGFEKLVKTEMK